MDKEREPSLPDTLGVAEAWLAQMAYDPRKAAFVDATGRAQPALLVGHGNRDIMMFTRGSCLVVSLVVEISARTRADLARLPETAQRRIMGALRDQLLLQPRTNAFIDPPNAVSIAQVTRVAVEQVFRIGPKDPASFNRLADGIQEVSNAAVGAFARVGAIFDAATRPPGSRDPPPAGMYA